MKSECSLGKNMSRVSYLMEYTCDLSVVLGHVNIILQVNTCQDNGEVDVCEHVTLFEFLQHVNL